MTHRFDLVVVGCGPGGYVAAREAARRRLRVAVVEKGPLGGTCLNWGCIPTKIFLGAASPLSELESLSRMRLVTGRLDLNLQALQKRRTQVVTASQKLMAARLEQDGVTVFTGSARLLGPNRMLVTGPQDLELDFTSCILASGSRPRALPGLKPDGTTLFSSNQLLDATEPPHHLVVVGGGAIGLELAQFFNLLGSRITVVEALPRIAPAEDPEVSQVLFQLFKRRGWALHPGTRLESVLPAGDEAEISLDTGAQLRADAVLLAAGRTAVTEGLGLEAAGARTQENGFIATDGFLKAADTVYAIGDCNGRTLLAHAAEQQGRFAVKHITGTTSGPFPDHPCPSCMYGPVEVMRAGRSVSDLQDQGVPVRVSRFLLAGNPIAQAHGAAHGLVKIIWGKESIQGITAVGRGVSSLVTLSEILTSRAWTRDQVADLVFAHPTLDEALKEAVLAPQETVTD